MLLAAGASTAGLIAQTDSECCLCDKNKKSLRVTQGWKWAKLSALYVKELDKKQNKTVVSIITGPQKWSSLMYVSIMHLSHETVYAKSSHYTYMRPLASTSTLCRDYFESSGTVLFGIKSRSAGVSERRGLLLVNENACWMRRKE